MEQEKSRNRRGTHPNSLANLSKGRNKHGAPRRGLSWKELIEQVGRERPPKDSPARGLGSTWKLAVVRAAFRHAAAGNAAILKELMQRSEPQPHEIIIHGDWREAARAAGLDEAEVLAEAERLINESNYAAGDQELGAAPGE